MNLIEKVREHLKTGINTTPPFLHLFRYTSKTIPMPQVETLYIYFVLDGEFRLYTPGGMLDYVAGQYSVSAIDTPEKGYVLAFSEQQDFLTYLLYGVLQRYYTTADGREKCIASSVRSLQQ